MDLTLSDFEYALDARLIAQAPPARRDRSRLMRLRRDGGERSHQVFADLGALLRAGDLLVLNDTRVIPARFFCRRRTGGRIEGLFLREVDARRWEVMLKGADRCRTDEVLSFIGAADAVLRLQDNLGQGRWLVELVRDDPADRRSAVEVLELIGVTPLPPYIRRPCPVDEAHGREVHDAPDAPAAAHSSPDPYGEDACPANHDRRDACPTNHDGRDACPTNHDGRDTGPANHDRRDACPTNPDRRDACPADDDRRDACPTNPDRRDACPTNPDRRDARPASDDTRDAHPADDRERYQTVYAAVPGAVAAPTAGLHFTRELLDALHDGGIRTARVTLHVGLGTFAPVTAERLAEHRMHAEWYDLPAATADALNAARRAARRIVAVGTTSVRVLESAIRGEAPAGGAPAREFRPVSGWTDLFIYPPARFRAVDAMITNFHLPRSTLLMLVAAFCSPGTTDGVRMILDAYADAQRREYRFYSYGDAMLIE